MSSQDDIQKCTGQLVTTNPYGQMLTEVWKFSNYDLGAHFASTFLLS